MDETTLNVSQQHIIKTPTYNIGRLQSNNLILNNESISR